MYVTPAITGEQMVEVSSFRRLPQCVPGIVDELDARGFVTLWSNTSALSTRLVASGQISGIVWTADSPWDVAAAKLIVDEAGGVLTDLSGNEQRYDRSLNGFIAGRGQKVHEELLDAVTKCGIEQGSRPRWTP